MVGRFYKLTIEFLMIKVLIVVTIIIRSFSAWLPELVKGVVMLRPPGGSLEGSMATREIALITEHRWLVVFQKLKVIRITWKHCEHQRMFVFEWCHKSHDSPNLLSNQFLLSLDSLTNHSSLGARKPPLSYMPPKRKTPPSVCPCFCVTSKCSAEPFQPSKRSGRGKTVKRSKPADVDLAMASTDKTMRAQSPTMDDTPGETKGRTMPSRSRKNAHPGIIARGSTRRTAAQVAADKAHKDDAMKMKKLEEVANLQALALLNVKADERGALRKSKAIRRISDIPEEDDVFDKAGDEEFILLEEKGSGEEDNEGDNIEVLEDRNASEDEVGDEVIPKAPTKKNKKQVTVSFQIVRRAFNNDRLLFSGCFEGDTCRDGGRVEEKSVCFSLIKVIINALMN